MIQTLQLDKWDDQELHTLFAANLPVLALPEEFAEQLTQSVLGEIAQHVQIQLTAEPEGTPEQQPRSGRHRTSRPPLGS